MDVSDTATLHEELSLSIALQQRRPQLAAIGYCHNCNEPCNGCYCCSGCRDDYEKREKFHR